MSYSPHVDPSEGPMLTCLLCGITSRSSRWGQTLPELRGPSSQAVSLPVCPSCGRVCTPAVSKPDHGQRIAGQTASTDPRKHDEHGPPSTAGERRVEVEVYVEGVTKPIGKVEVRIEADGRRMLQGLRAMRRDSPR